MSNNAMSNETDLDWLARNVHKWPEGKREVLVCWPRNVDTLIWSSVLSDAGWITKDQWLARRAELQNKPSWGDHQWPQIFQNEGGNWFGARSGWDFKAHISGGWKGEGVSLMRDDGEYMQSGTILGDWRDTLEKRPEQNEFEPFVSVEDSKEQDMKQDNGWFERGELPPVGCLCLYVVSDRLSAEVEITAHAKFGLCFVQVGTSGESYVSKTAELHRLRPIRTERDVLIETIKNTDDTDDKIADAILAAGFSLRGK